MFCDFDGKLVSQLDVEFDFMNMLYFRVSKN